MPTRARADGYGSSKQTPTTPFQSDTVPLSDHPLKASDSTASSSTASHTGKDASRQTSLPEQLPHPDIYGTGGIGDRADQESEESNGWDDGDGESTTWEPDNMPSDLRPSLDRPNKSYAHDPLLSGDKQHDYESPSRPALGSRRSSRFLERASDVEARNDTKTRYTYAAIFLIISLISFAVQTETAVYIQHDLNWKKPYCMLYLTHGSWTLLWPTQLLILRLQKWNQPWDAFWRRHVSIIRSTAQMIEHRNLQLSPLQQKKSPLPYFIRTTAFVTCALTVAGGSWYVAVDLTTASDLTAIYNCSAFFAYAFAVPLLGEKLRWSKVAAVAVAIVGVLVVAYGDAGSAKHGSKSGGGAGGPSAPADDEASNRALGNIVIGIGSVLYGFYEVLYKKVACPPEGCSPGRGMLFANTFGSLIGLFTLSVLWIPIPLLHITGIETFALPTGRAAWMMLISVMANATFSGSFLVLISLTSPVLSSVAALLTIFLVALCDQILPPPMYSPLTPAAIAGGVLIIAAFLVLAWATYREMEEEGKKKAEETIAESDVEDF